jgi:hypothetical protein
MTFPLGSYFITSRLLGRERNRTSAIEMRFLLCRNDKLHELGSISLFKETHRNSIL